MGTFLIGYDVEWRGDDEVTPHFLAQARSLHNRLGIPATLFIVGQTLERWIPQFQAIAQDPLFDLQQHTYSHQLLKTVCIDDGKSIRVVRGVSPEETRQEVRKTTESAASDVGRRVHWAHRSVVLLPRLTRPAGHPAGPLGRKASGSRARTGATSTIGIRWPSICNRTGTRPCGFPDMLEIPIHGWHDCVIRAEVLGWDDLDGYVDSVRAVSSTAPRPKTRSSPSASTTGRVPALTRR